jgi:hypothetical protein
MKYDWRCVDCGGHGSIVHSGLPVTLLINKCAFQHIETSPNCETAKSSAVTLLPGECVFRRAEEARA